MKSLFKNAETMLGQAERSIALLERCVPLNAVGESRRLRESWERGRPLAPTWVYRAPPDLGVLRNSLVRAARELETRGPLGRLFAERALELELEANLAEQVGSPSFAALSRCRFAPLCAMSDREVSGFFVESTASSEKTSLSDDAQARGSLLRQLVALLEEERLSMPVVVKKDLNSLAATGSDAIFLRAGVRLPDPVARAVAVHEVYGHARPLFLARERQIGLFRVGSAKGRDTEEGRALALERRLGVFLEERSRRLALRHIAAQTVVTGGGFVDVVKRLLELAVNQAESLEIATRVCRGGGLAREVVYLPALKHVEAELAIDPELDLWIGSGPVSVEAAKVLRDIEPEAEEALPIRRAYTSAKVAQTGA